MPDLVSEAQPVVVKSVERTLSLSISPQLATIHAAQSTKHSFFIEQLI
jgi:hypothetical protein